MIRPIKIYGTYQSVDTEKPILKILVCTTIFFVWQRLYFLEHNIVECLK